MRQATTVTLYFSKQELAEALELYVRNTHPALASHFTNGCQFETFVNPNTDELSELAVTFGTPKTHVAPPSDETRIFSKQK
jgi:hypothetical protein